MARRPFRLPLHTGSNYAGLIGGGNSPTSGDSRLSHNGTLCKDGSPKVNCRTVAVLSQPLEDGTAFRPENYPEKLSGPRTGQLGLAAILHRRVQYFSYDVRFEACSGELPKVAGRLYPS